MACEWARVDGLKSPCDMQAAIRQAGLQPTNRRILAERRSHRCPDMFIQRWARAGIWTTLIRRSNNKESGFDRPSNQLFDVYFTSAPMREVFSDRGRVQGMLDFEAALAGSADRVIPATAVDAIEAACHAERPGALAEAVATAGNSAIPLVKALGRQVAANDPDAEKYVHLGATSQDAMDSGLVLQLRRPSRCSRRTCAVSATRWPTRPRAMPRPRWPGAPGCSMQPR